jgi:hypothetical protein
MIKFFCPLLFILLPVFSNAQGVDGELEGKWELFEIIDNMTGDVIKPAPVSSNKDFKYFIEFQDNIVKYNLDINKCSNEIIVKKDRTIEFKYFSECTEICCDEEFSKILTYEDCTNYIIKDKKTLILISEDRIFYFSKG